MITSVTNTRIREARKLQRRKGRREQHAVLLEGARLIRDALHAQADLRQLFYIPDRVESQPIVAEVISLAASRRVDMDPCTPEVFATLTGTVTPQGVAAVAALPELPWPSPLAPLLILDRLRDPGNAGTLLRTAEATGVQGVVFGPETVDPYNDKVMRAGMGAHFRVPVREAPGWDEIDAWLSAQQSLFVADAAAPLAYYEVDWCGSAALVVGGEAEGASTSARRRATPISIPMQGQVESLNAAIAGAVILFEAARQRREADKHAAPPGPR